MSGLFDRLQEELDNKEKQGGIDPLDLAELPSSLRKLVKHMLREVEATFENLAEAAQALPGGDSLTKDELAEALAALTKQGWLISLGEEGNMRYRVNLRRKAANTLASSIWASLDQKIEEHSKKEQPKDTGES